MQPLPSPNAAPIDWQRVALWHQDLVADRLDRIRAAFEAASLGRLEMIRSPVPSAPQAASNRFLLADWHAQRRGAVPPISAIDPVRLAPALGRILIVEPVEAGRDFRYRLFGSDLAALSGIEMTGKLLSAHPTAPEHVCFALAAYRMLQARPEPVLTVFEPPIAGYARWERIILPFAGPEGAVMRFMVGNVGFDRHGQEMHG
jgi:PAS domain